MRLIIHGGIHRTGSTALQKFLSGNRQLLARHGITYPFDTANHQRIAWDIFAGRLPGPKLVSLLQEATAGGDNQALLLSGEDFSIHKDLTWLKPVSAAFQVEAHFYLRRQDIWLMSWYNQHVKWPFDRRKSKLSPDEFLQTLDDYHWIDYSWLAQTWAAAIGADNVRLHVFEEGTNVIADFCRHIGVVLDDKHRPAQSENESLPPQVLDFVRHFDVQSLGPAQRTRLLTAVRQLCDEREFPPTHIYSPMVRNLILDRFAESNRRVARENLGFENGQLFKTDRVKLDEPYTTARLPHSEELMRSYVVPLVRALLGPKAQPK